MNQKWVLRALVAAALMLATVLSWERVREPARKGDVPYVPTRPEVVDRMLELAGVGADDLVFDLGSGDGRILIRAAEARGARGRGFELDPALVAESRANAAAAGVADKVEFVEGDLFNAELSEATVVTLYLLPTVNVSLRPRLFAQLAPGTPVVSQTFDMAEWRADARETVPLDPPAELYLWIIPAGAGGTWDLDLGPGAADPENDLPGGAPVLRLLQRFQELEGELSLGALGVAVSGSVEGDRVTLETTRPHADLGRLRFIGVLDDDQWTGELLAAGDASGKPAPRMRRRFTAIRRPAELEGVWDLGPPGEPFVPQWSLRLSAVGGRWAASRWPLDAGEVRAADRLPGSPPAAGAKAAAERAMSDLYVMGSSISFVVGAQRGSARRAVYHGLVEGDRIAGVIHSGGALVPWSAVRRRERR